MKPVPVFTFTCPVKTNSGSKALEHLPVELANLNAVKPIVITGVEAVGGKAVRTLAGAFGDSGMTYALFDGVSPAANLALIENLKITCIENQYDAVIALGGGTIVDVAKVLNMAVSLKTADARQLSPQTPLRKHLNPLVVVPTAEASGLETSKLAHLDRNVFSSEYLAPNLVVIDPRLTRAADGKTIAATGLAALSRALEAHISTDKNPFRDAYSFAAIRFIKENLLAAVNNPGDKKASLAVANAAAMSGCAFSNAENGLLHKLGQVFQDMQQLPAGMVMGMFLPSVCGHYLNKGDNDLAALLHPLAGDDAFVQTPAAKRAEAALDLLDRFLAGLRGALGKDMPQNFKEAGVPGYRMEEILDVLANDREGSALCAIVKRLWNQQPMPF